MEVEAKNRKLRTIVDSLYDASRGLTNAARALEELVIANGPMTDTQKAKFVQTSGRLGLAYGFIPWEVEKYSSPHGRRRAFATRLIDAGHVEVEVGGLPTATFEVPLECFTPSADAYFASGGTDEEHAEDMAKIKDAIKEITLEADMPGLRQLNPLREIEARTKIPGRVLDQWGVCPTCKSRDGCINIGASHWYYCRKHRVKWCVGDNLFSTWRDQTEAEQRAIYDGLDFGKFEEIRPLHLELPDQTEAERADLDDIPF
jgi:hypothetical protein